AQAPAKAASAPAKAAPANPPQPLSPYAAVPNQSPVEKTSAARQLLVQGRKALQNKDYAVAQQLADRAHALRPELQWWEDNPDKLMADVNRQLAAAPRPASGVQQVKAESRPVEAKQEDPRALLKQARELYSNGKLEEADKACQRVATASSVRWGLFEDSPDKLRADIQKARTRRDREDSVHVLAEARKLLASGDLKQAKSKAYQAKQMHGPYSIC